jgi:hypothetical protein
VPGPETSTCWVTGDRLPWCSDVPGSLVGHWSGPVTLYPPLNGTIAGGVTAWTSRLEVDRGGVGEEVALAVTTGLDAGGADWGCTDRYRLESPPRDEDPGTLFVMAGTSRPNDTARLGPSRACPSRTLRVVPAGDDGIRVEWTFTDGTQTLAGEGTLARGG